MRISDWSSDVCSSDLLDRIGQGAGAVARGRIGERLADGGRGTRGGGFDRIGGHAFLAFLVPEIHRYGSRCSYRHVPVCIESGANPPATPGAARSGEQNATPRPSTCANERTGGVEGKGESVLVDLGGQRV